MPQTENHYVFIIHGTFNPPSPPGEPPQWYQPDGEFAQRLAQELERLDPAWKGAVWRAHPKLTDKSGFFMWTGENTHAARLKAARELKMMMDSIWMEDPQARFHLIGHSHGGNVILKALEEYGAEMANLEAVALNGITKKDEPQTKTDGKFDIETEMAKRYELVKQALGAEWGERPLANAPEWHRLGRVVFLGTPFFHKRWRRTETQLRQRQALVRALDLTGWLLLGIVLLGALAALLCYLPTIGLSALLNAAGQSAFIGFDPLGWPGWMAGIFWLAVILGGLGLLLLVIGVRSDPRRDLEPGNTNYYFDRINSEWLAPGAAAPRLPALVVNAGALDEALMALSSEPLVRMFVRPMVASFTEFRLETEAPPPEAGVPHNLEGIVQRLRKLWLWARRITVGPVMALLRPLVQHRATDWLMNTFRQVLVSGASGLPPHEVDDADLVVGTLPDVAALDAGQVWDLSEYLAAHRTEAEAVMDPRRYAFFWDAAIREARFRQSRIYAQLAGPYANDPLLADAEFQRMCLAIEERMLEVLGGVEVLHARYHHDPAIANAVARFIFDGTRPAPLKPA